MTRKTFLQTLGQDFKFGLRTMRKNLSFSVALVLTIGLFSLAGMPLFAGFFTKFFLFQAGARHDLLWLVGFGVVNSMISLYYYLLVIKQLYTGTPSAAADGTRIRVPMFMSGLLGLLTLGVFFVGLYPLPLLKDQQQEPRPVGGGGG